MLKINREIYKVQLFSRFTNFRTIVIKLSLGVARIQGLFVYARLISQSRGSIPYRGWCWSLESVHSKGAGTSLTLGYCGEQQQRGQETYNI